MPIRKITAVCTSCCDYTSGALYRTRGDRHLHLNNSSVRCPGQGDDDTDDRATPQPLEWLRTLHSSGASQVGKAMLEEYAEQLTLEQRCHIAQRTPDLARLVDAVVEPDEMLQLLNQAQHARRVSPAARRMAAALPLEQRHLDLPALALLLD